MSKTKRGGAVKGEMQKERLTGDRELREIEIERVTMKEGKNRGTFPE